MVSRRSVLLTVPLGAAALTAAPHQSPALQPVGLSGGLAPSDPPEPVRVPPEPASAEPAVAAVRSFTADLYRKLASSGAGSNVVCAPFSVALALAMTRAGAVATTADEMDAVLHAPEPRPGALDSGLNTVDQLLIAGHRDGDGQKRPLLTTANALWTRLDVDPKPAFLETLAGYYGAAEHPVDFESAPEAAREEINAWVSDRTNARIPELLAFGAVRSDTSLVLTNAIYLKAAWTYPFPLASTRPAPFTRDDGQVVEVPMMAGPFNRMGYLEGDGWRAVNVPYEGAPLAMAIVMPTSGDLAGLEAKLDGAWLGSLLRGFRYEDVLLRLPRWTVRQPAELRAPLSELGMPTAFTDRADFSGLTGDNLCIDNVVHQTFIGVDEKGTEAAAATAVIVRPPSIPQGPSFFADRPFLYIINEQSSGLPLFIGRVHDPLSTGPA
ncbi:serpin family protein [Jidongwangia harbinensis]|uniref:serpin family protein n=1 Tax=Jidongwangia harbinensis TaxID=2878561 RepID=UPI001CDA177F|nr:serpin family protein [Jidongwangia harbinensis]MCA2216618.1 serpin family protein [Jidongwangia harbinensis]